MSIRSGNSYTKQVILDNLIKLIQETCGWDMQFEGSIGPDTFLGADLALKSLDFVRLISAIHKHFNSGSIPFQELFVSQDGTILTDVQISTLVNFLYEHL